MKKSILTFALLLYVVFSFSQVKMERHSCKKPIIEAQTAAFYYNGNNYDWGMSYSASVFNCRWLRVGLVAGPYNATVSNYYVAIEYTTNTSNTLTVPKTYFYGYAGVNQVPFYARSFIETDEGIFYSDNIYFGSSVFPPSISTTSLSSISSSSAYSGGNITNNGGSSITSRGVVWGYDSSVSLSNNIGSTSDGTGDGSFTSYISGLLSGTTYYVRAYAVNSVGTGYGDALQFTTQQTVYAPTVTTNSISSITSNSAYSGGTVSYSGGGSVTEKGVCWNTTGTPNYNNSKTNDGTGVNSFTSYISALEPNTTYYVRAYARACGIVNGFNVCAVGYGQEEVFTTSGTGCVLPYIISSSCNNETNNSIDVTATISSDGGCSVTSRGFQYSTDASFNTVLGSVTASGTGVGQYYATISGLDCGVHYYFRPWATNSVGTYYATSLVGTGCTTISHPEYTLTSGFFYSITSSTCFSGDFTSSFNSACNAKAEYFNTSICHASLIGRSYRTQSGTLNVGDKLYYFDGCEVNTTGYELNNDYNVVYILNGVIQSITSCP